MTAEAVRDLARHKDNKFCFDCGLNGPHQNVCLSYNIFVCTVCAGVHRSFHHIVKTLNMATFTPENVEGLRKGGNRRAKKQWLANYDPTENPVHSDNPHTVKVFIKQCFEEAKWVHKEGDPKKKKKKKDRAGDETKTEKKKKKKKQRDEEQEQEPEQQQEGVFTSLPSPSEQQQQHSQQQQNTQQAPSSTSVDLLDLFGGSLSISDQPLAQQQQQQQQHYQQQQQHYQQQQQQHPSASQMSYQPSLLPSSSSSSSSSSLLAENNFYSVAPASSFYSSTRTPAVPTTFSSLPSSSFGSFAVPSASPFFSASSPAVTSSSSSHSSHVIEQATEQLKKEFASIRNSTSLSDEEWKECVTQALQQVTGSNVVAATGASAAAATSVPLKPKEDVFADLMGETEGVTLHLGMETQMQDSNQGAMMYGRGMFSGSAPLALPPPPSSSYPGVNMSMMRNPFLPANTLNAFQGPNPFMMNLSTAAVPAASSASVPPSSSIPSFFSMLPPAVAPSYLGPAASAAPSALPYHSSQSSSSFPLPSFASATPKSTFPAFNPFLPLPLNNNNNNSTQRSSFTSPPSATASTSNPFLNAAAIPAATASTPTNSLPSLPLINPFLPSFAMQPPGSVSSTSQLPLNTLPAANSFLSSFVPLVNTPSSATATSSASTLPRAENPFLSSLSFQSSTAASTPVNQLHPPTIYPTASMPTPSSSSSSANPFLSGLSALPNAPLKSNPFLSSTLNMPQTALFPPPSIQPSPSPSSSNALSQSSSSNPNAFLSLGGSSSFLSPTSFPGNNYQPSSNLSLDQSSLSASSSPASSSPASSSPASSSPASSSPASSSPASSYVNPFLPSTSSAPPPFKPPPPPVNHQASENTPKTASYNPFDSITTPFVHTDSSNGGVLDFFSPLETAGEHKDGGDARSRGSQQENGGVFGAGDWGDFAASGLDGSGSSQSTKVATSDFMNGTPRSRPGGFSRGFKPPLPKSPPPPTIPPPAPVTFPSGSIPG